MSTQYNSVVVGAGFLGLSLSLALAQENMRVGLIEAKFKPDLSTIALDPRGIVLSAASQCVIERLGLWPKLSGVAVPIQKIHVSEKGKFGALRFSAEQERVLALGYVVPAGHLLQVLWQAVMEHPNITAFYSAQVSALDLQVRKPSIQFNTDGFVQTLSGDLIVGADGTQSAVRKLANIAVKRWGEDYQSLISSVVVSRPNHIAYERFIQRGALAMIPMQDHYKSIWTLPSEEIQHLLSLSNLEFSQHLQRQFGYRLGKIITLGERKAFSLSIVHAKQLVVSGLALIGNAAHTIYPIAAQGLNLGLRDVVALVDIIKQAGNHRENIGDLAVLNRYTSLRERDHQRMIAFTGQLLQLFSSRRLPIKCARNLSLLALELLPVAKHAFAKRAMGFGNKLELA